QRGRGFSYISEALDLERFTLYTLSPTAERTRLFIAYVRTAMRDGAPLREDPRVRQRVARAATDTAVAQALSQRFVGAAKDVRGKPPTAEASQYKLFSTELGQRVCRDALDVMSAVGQLREGQQDAPLRGRFEHAYRATAIDTLGGGSSEIQKNIIARR